MKTRAAFFTLVFFILSIATFAQTSRGTVSGTVTDPTGAVISGANVTLTNTATTVSRSTVTNSEGIYRFDAVDLGDYTIKFTATGFGEVLKSNVVVSANQIAAVDTQLQPGATSLTVDVTAESGALLQTEAPVRGGNIDSTRITELPVATRNPAMLALTLPGVSTNRFGFGVGTFSVNGGRGRSNNFLIDGTENNDISVAGQGFQIKNPDAVQEVSVQTSIMTRSSGARAALWSTSSPSPEAINITARRRGNTIRGATTRSPTRSRSPPRSAIAATRHMALSTSSRALSAARSNCRARPRRTVALGRQGPHIFFFAYQNQRQASNTVATVLTPLPPDAPPCARFSRPARTARR